MLIRVNKIAAMSPMWPLHNR